MNLDKRFSNSLLNIYNLDIIKYFIRFLQGEQAVLFALYIGNEKHPSKISEKLDITKARMSGIIKSLKEKDMIETKPDLNDKRKTTLFLKVNGRNFIKTKEEEILNVFKYFHQQMGDEKILKLTELLELTSNIMKGVKK